MGSLRPGHAVSAVSLANYEGSAGTLVDTNIWIDCIDDASPWRDWAVEQLQTYSERSPLHVNLIIYTELLVPGPSIDAAVANLRVLTRDPAPYKSCFPRLAIVAP